MWILSAYREGTTDADDIAWLASELHNLRTSDDVNAYVASIGGLIAGLIQISSTFLDGWAHAQGTDGATLLNIVRRLNDDSLGGWKA